MAMRGRTALRTGDAVRVKSREEILRTLDQKGQLEGLPFMPQMFEYCGRTFTVYRRAHKTCDTVNPVRGARVSDAVHLNLRCDGAAYAGCQAACLIFWKTAWLTPLGGSRGGDVPADAAERIDRPDIPGACTEATVSAATMTQGADGPRYVCQATQVPFFTTTLRWWDVSQYVEDYMSGNVTIGRMLRGGVYASYASLVQAGVGLGPALRWLYDRFSSLWGDTLYPRSSGTVPVGRPTPMSTLDLQPGELVRVKSHRDILATLDREGRNRGMMFDREMVPYCGGTYRVRSRVTRFIDERTGKPSTLKSAAVILEGVTCQARYSDHRMFCPRSIYPWWRETWLERVSAPAPEPSRAGVAPPSCGHVCGKTLVPR
jgi:hypothetical protein